MSSFTITEVDPRSAAVHALLRMHWEFTAEVTPPEHIHALDLDGLLDDAVTMFGLWAGDQLLAIGALKTISNHHVEIKSMHTVAAARGRGVARALLAYLLDEARRRGATRASLETGKQDEFMPAIALYAAASFERCGPFEGYEENDNSIFMTLELE